MLEAVNITKIYGARVTALAGVSLKVTPGRTLGIVGESGSGKSTLARILMDLEDPSSGDILYEGRNVRVLSREDRKNFRKNISVIFQDPLSSLDPRMRISEILKEPFEIHGMPDNMSPVGNGLKPFPTQTGVGCAGPGQWPIGELMSKVGLPSFMLNRYPHELSGGERQRVCIARAIALKPKIVVCDEAVSSLDVLVRAQILNLLLTLQKEDGLGYVFISHDLAVVRHLSDEVLVLKEGKIVEQGASNAVFLRPKEAYTRELIESSQIKIL